MSPTFCITALLTLGLLTVNCAGQSNLSQREQEKLMAQAAALAEKQDKAVDALILEVQADIAAKAPIKSYDEILTKISVLRLEGKYQYSQNMKLEALRSFTTSYQNFLFEIQQNDFDTAITTLSQIIQESTILPIIPHSNLLELQIKMVEQRENYNKAMLAPVITDLDNLLITPSFSEAVTALLNEVTKLQNKESLVHPNRNNNASLQEIYQFAYQLKEMSLLQDAGKFPEAEAILKKLTSDSFGNYNTGSLTGPVRAKLLELSIKGSASKSKSSDLQPSSPANSNKSPQNAFAPATLTLDNLDNAQTELIYENSVGSKNETEVRARGGILATIAAYRAARDLINNQQINQALGQLNGYYPDMAQAYVAPLNTIRQKLLIQAICSQGGSKLVALPDESATDFLKRYIHVQCDQKNWRSAYEALKIVPIGRIEFSADDSAVSPIFLSLITQSNEEAVGHLQPVLQAYFRALHNPSFLVPTEEIIARLNKLKAEHPKEYAEAENSTGNSSDKVPPYLRQNRGNQ